MNKLEFVPVKGYEESYLISRDGIVISLHAKTKKLKQMKIYKSKNGYLYVELSRGGIAKKYYLHRLIAEAFVLNPNNLPEINHIDENKENNSIENLEWCTHQENTRHSFCRKTPKEMERRRKISASLRGVLL